MRPTVASEIETAQLSSRCTGSELAQTRPRGQVSGLQYVVKGGDYRRAVEILERTLEFDPDNLDALARLAEYQEMRYMAAERFTKVKRGMTEAEVEVERRILGKVYHSYVWTFRTEGVSRGSIRRTPSGMVPVRQPACSSVAVNGRSTGPISTRSRGVEHQLQLLAGTR